MGPGHFTRETACCDKSSGSVAGRADPRRVLRGAGGPGRGARASGSRVGVRWKCPETGATADFKSVIKMPPGSYLGLAGGLAPAFRAGFKNGESERTTAPTAQRCRRTKTIRTATSFSTTPRGGTTPLPRHAQPLFVLFRSTPPNEGGGKEPPERRIGASRAEWPEIRQCQSVMAAAPSRAGVNAHWVLPAPFLRRGAGPS